MAIVRIKTALLKKKGLAKLTRLDNFLTVNTGPNSLSGLVDELGRQIWVNILTRYSQAVTGGSGHLFYIMVDQMAQSHVRTVSEGLFEYNIGDVSDLEQQTQTVSKGTGAVYSYWSLLEFGWGKEGGTRDDRYLLYYLERPFVPPAWVEAEEGEKVKDLTKVTHPGFAGINVFLAKSGAMHDADLNLVPAIMTRIKHEVERIAKG